MMNNLRLTDLDELVLTVRDKVSLSYILEAVNTYRAGAYRAAIVSTWIAVSYDIIAKIRELNSHTLLYEQTMLAQLPKIAEGLEDDQLLSSIYAFMEVDKRCWDWLNEAERIRFNQLSQPPD